MLRLSLGRGIGYIQHGLQFEASIDNQTFQFGLNGTSKGVVYIDNCINRHLGTDDRYNRQNAHSVSQAALKAQQEADRQNALLIQQYQYQLQAQQAQIQAQLQAQQLAAQQAQQAQQAQYEYERRQRCSIAQQQLAAASEPQQFRVPNGVVLSITADVMRYCY